MHDLREQLLKAGLVTKDQVATAGGKASRPNKRKTGAGKSPRSASTRPAPKIEDPTTLAVMQAIERHRVRGETTGPVPFHFQLRSGKIRKLYINELTARKLESGAWAIVENGSSERHVIVTRDAVRLVADADPGALRFFNDSMELDVVEPSQIAAADAPPPAPGAAKS